MNQSKPPAPSVTVMVAEEVAAFAKRLTVLPITPEDRAVVLNLLRETCEAFASVTTNIANDVVEETPSGGTLGTPDWMPAAGRLVVELSNVGSRLAEARDGFEDAGKAVEDIATEQAEQAAAVGAELDTVDGDIIDGRQALIDSGKALGPDGAFMTKAGREALPRLVAKLRAEYGVTR